VFEYSPVMPNLAFSEFIKFIMSILNEAFPNFDIPFDFLTFAMGHGYSKFILTKYIYAIEK